MSKSFKVSEAYAEATERAGAYGAMANHVGYGFTHNSDGSINVVKWSKRVCCVWPDRIEVYTDKDPKDGEHGGFPTVGKFDFNVKCAPRSVKHGEVAVFEAFNEAHVIPRGDTVRVDDGGRITHTPLPERTTDKAKARAATAKVREILMVAAASARLTSASADDRLYFDNKDVAKMALEGTPDITQLSHWREFWHRNNRAGGSVLRPSEDIKRVINNFINRNKNTIYELAGAFE
jgi:hypothetical protein